MTGLRYKPNGCYFDCGVLSLSLDEGLLFHLEASGVVVELPIEDFGISGPALKVDSGRVWLTHPCWDSEPSKWEL